MRLPSGDTITNNAAHIVLDGSGSNLYEGNLGTSDALAGFVNNLAAGRFEIINSRDFTTAAGFSNAGVMEIGPFSTFTVGGTGLYTQTEGNTIVDGTLAIPGGLLLTGGMLTGSGDIIGGIINSGQINPGGSPGLLTVNGDYSQTAGILTIEIGESAHDQLLVLGTATLGGTLDVQLWTAPGDPPFGGAPGTFDVLVAADIVNGFDNVLLPTLSGGEIWNIEYLKDAIGSNDVVRLSLEAIPEPASLWFVGTALAGLAPLARRRIRSGVR
jgi:hypothetical protein